MTSAQANTTPSSMTEIYRDEYMNVTVEEPGSLIRVQRSNLLHPTPMVLELSFRQAAAAIDRFGRTNRVMLVDVREARGRNEPEFDAALRKIRPLMEKGLTRIAVLLRSSAGMLQMKRINDEDGVMRMLTMDEQEALAFLRSTRA